MIRRLLLGALAGLSAAACYSGMDAGESLDADAEIAQVEQPLTLNKRRITYNFLKHPDGFYAPKITWVVDGTPDQISRGGAVPGTVTMTDLGNGTTRVDYQRLSNAYVEDVWQNALAAWASVTNVEFVRVSGKPEIVLTLNENSESKPASSPRAEGYWDWGSTVAINLMVQKTDDGQFWDPGDHIPVLLEPGYEHNFMMNAVHELGHALLRSGRHAFDDTVNYARDQNGNVRGCTGTPCWGDEDHELAVMDYNTLGRVLLNSWDIREVQAIYGIPKHKPLIELHLPFMGQNANGQYFYTNSWEEATGIIRREWDRGARFKRVVGVTYANGAPTALRSALHRHFDSNLNGHTITYGSPTSGSGITYEGILGYAAKGTTPELVPLGLYQVSGTDDYRFFQVGTMPSGHSDTGVRFGHIVPRANVGKRAALDDGGYYRIVNRTSGKVLDVAGNSTADGAKIHQWTWVWGHNQQFRFRDTGDGLYAIMPRNSTSTPQKGLEVGGAAAHDGAQINQWSHREQAHQEWLVEPIGNGYYRIRARHDGKCLDNPGGSIQNGAVLQQWACSSGDNANQQFLIQKVDQEITNGPEAYRIVNRNSGKAVDVSGVSLNDGALVHQWTYGGGDNQKWLVNQSPNAGYVTITAKHSFKFLSIASSSTPSADGVPAEQRSWQSLTRQEWKLQPTGDGYFKFVARHSNKCLDVAGAGTANGVRLQQWTCTTNYAQQFLLERVE